MDAPTRKRCKRVLLAWDAPTIMAANCYAEARGEGEAGMQAVAWVVKNRMRKRHKTASQIITAKAQFSWTNPDDPNFWTVLRAVGSNNKLWASAYMIASNEFSIGRIDPVLGADHYANVELVRKMRRNYTESLPRWLRLAIQKNKMTIKIGNHSFFKLEGG